MVRAQVVDTAAVRREVDSLLQISTKLWRAEKNKEALLVAQNATNISKENLGENNAIYAASLHRLASIYTSLKQIDTAEAIYLKAIELREKILTKEHPDYPRSLNNLANLYKEKKEYLKSENLLIESSKIQKKILGPGNPEYITSLIGLADIYALMRNYAKIDTLYLEALRLEADFQIRKHPSHAKFYNLLANIYTEREDYDKAEFLYLRSKNIYDNTLKNKDADYAKCLIDMAVMYQYKGFLDKPESLFKEGKEIICKAKGKSSQDYASALNNLANYYRDIGDYGSAEEFYLESLNIKEKILGKTHPSYGSSLRNLALLYSYKGDYANAERLYLEALELWKKSYGERSREYALILNDLGIIYMVNKDYEKAKTLFLESKIIRKAIFGEGHSEYASSLNNLAMLYINIGDLTNAEQLCLEAKEVVLKSLGSEHPIYAKILNNLALSYALKGDLTKSELYYLQAIDIKSKSIGVEHPSYIATLNEISQLYYKTNRTTKAIAGFRKATETIRHLILIASAYSSENQMHAYIEKFKPELDRFYYVCIESKNSMLCRESFNNALFLKGFLLETSNKIQKLTKSNITSDSIANLHKSYLRRLSIEYAKPIAERDSARIAEWEEKANAIEKELVRTVAGYGDLIRQVSWEEVKQQLRPNEAAVELVSYRYYTPEPTDSTMYAALVLLPTDTAPHFIPLFEERQLQALFNRPGYNEELTVKRLYAANSELLNLLWKPLEPLLRDVKTIYYSPAGLLHRINPAALRDAGKQPLSEGRQWVRVGSTRELVTGHLADRSFAEGPAASPTAAVWGGIRYDMDSTAFAAANPLYSMAEPLPEFQRKDGKFRYMVEDSTPALPNGLRGAGDDWKPLAGSAREAEQVGALLRKAGFRTEVFSDYSASEEHFKTLGQTAPSPRILHVATHGFAYPDPKKEPRQGFAGQEPVYKLQDDPMLRSGLVLAGANYYWKNKRPLQNREDGVLVAYEVRDLNLRNTELAVLSACQTGLGDVVGSEGVYGLQRAFRIAGAKFLIVSLWQVPDEQTRELMRLFYENWVEKRESLRDAFNHAQARLREQEPNPYMWAGFVLVE